MSNNYATVPTVEITPAGIRTSRIGLGTSGWPHRYETKDVARVLESAFEIGIRHLDTAAKYNTEERIGDALAVIDLPDDLIVATKVCMYYDSELKIEYSSLSQDAVRRSVERSLKRLRRDYLDIVYVHDVRDVNLPLALADNGPFTVLQELKAAGVIRAVGMATRNLKVLEGTILSGMVDVIQSFHINTLLNQEGHTQIYPLAKERGIGILDCGPYAGYILATGPGEDSRYSYALAPEEVREAVRRIEVKCNEMGISVPDAAVAYSLRHPDVSVLTIGSGNPEHIRRWAELIDSPLSDSDFEILLSAAGGQFPLGRKRFEQYQL